MSTALLRAHYVLAEAGLPPDLPVARIESARNEVWFAGNYVLRLASNTRAHRLQHEANVVTLLPPEVRHPGIVASGTSQYGEWLVLPRIRAMPLARQWRRLDESQRHATIVALGRVLEAIHRVDASSLQPAFLAPGSLECSHQLPFDRLYAVIDRLRADRRFDRGLVEAAEALARRSEPIMGPWPTTLVHGDFHLENVLVQNGELKAVIDFEFARAGWPEIDLEILLRFCDEPELHAASDYSQHVKRDDFRSVVAWLREGYPALFSREHLSERVNLCSLSYDVRDLAMFPPDRPRAELATFHPANRLARLLDGRGLLQLIDW